MGVSLVKPPQGQSGDATEIKQRGLSFAFRVGLQVIRKWPNYRYHYIDLHAGSGFNSEARCIGSPLAFQSETRRANCSNYFAWLCDRDEGQIKQLLARPEIDHTRSEIFHGDNSELLYMIPDMVRHFSRENLQYVLGAVLSDPNGADVPIDAILDFAKICPRVDLIFHWNSTITKRLRNGIKPQQLVLDDVIGMLPKKFWLIREPAGIHQFTMVIGSNFRFNDWHAMGFYHLESAKGQDILQRCSLSIAEINKLRMSSQQALFE